MPIPDYQTLMRPVLEVLSDRETKTSSDVREAVAATLGITSEDRQPAIPSGQAVFDNRVNWATTYMVQAGLLRRPRRGRVEITDRGQDVLARYPDRVDNSVLEQFEQFRAFRERSQASRRRRASPSRAEVPAAEQLSPEERLSDAVEEANAAVATELLERLRQRDPAFLELVVLQVLQALGYGGREGSAEHLGGPNDQGLDGVIRQDALGLDRIYVQAKRYNWTQVVQRPEIQRFIGALHGAQADRGVFITTSRFSQGATDYADQVAARVVLIDGDELGRLMINHNVGAETTETYSLKRIDEDFFEEA